MEKTVDYLNVGPEAPVSGTEREIENLWASLRALREVIKSMESQMKSIEKRVLMLEARQR